MVRLYGSSNARAVCVFAGICLEKRFRIHNRKICRRFEVAKFRKFRFDLIPESEKGRLESNFVANQERNLSFSLPGGPSAPRPTTVVRADRFSSPISIGSL